jgi:sortase A
VADPRRVIGIVIGVVAALLIVGGVSAVVSGGRSDKGNGAAAASVATTVAPTIATTAPPTTVQSTTIAPTSTTTTVASATTVPAQSNPAKSKPVPPPADSNGSEPGGQVGTISIPKIGLDVGLFEGIRLTTLNKGPGHWPGSAEPGQVGNVVVGGHRTSHHADFRKLDQLVPGDIVTFTTADGTFNYAVTGTQIVTPDALWITNPTDTATATLFACHPLGSTRQRIVVSLALV